MRTLEIVAIIPQREIPSSTEVQPQLLLLYAVTHQLSDRQFPRPLSIVHTQYTSSICQYSGLQMLVVIFTTSDNYTKFKYNFSLAQYNILWKDTNR